MVGDSTRRYLMRIQWLVGISTAAMGLAILGASTLSAVDPSILVLASADDDRTELARGRRVLERPTGRHVAALPVVLVVLKKPGASMLVRVTSKRQVTFRPGCWTRWECGPAISSSSRKAQTVSSCVPGASTTTGSAGCAALRGGRGALDVGAFRDEPHDPALRD